MSTNRRSFLKISAAAGGALGLGGLPGLAGALERRTLASATRIEPAAAPLSILILGGTGFTGPEQVEYALARGHKITLLNRNKTRPDFFKGRVDQLIGDLNGDVSALAGKKFDVVIDNPTTFPAWVRNAAKYLKGNTGQYIFISTISVYPDDSQPNKDESDKTTPMPAGVDPYTTDTANYKYYGALKTFAEQEVQRQYPGINTIVRPGLIVGPLDPSDRFTYWPARIARGGTVLAPGQPTDPVQFIDARDLAEFMIRLAENHTLGVFNATGPSKPLTIAEMLYGIKAVTTAGAQFTWVPEDFLTAQKVSGWSDLPVWVGNSPDERGFARRNIDRALAAGLTFRPLAVTAKDTIDWIATLTAAQQQRIADAKRAGMTAARETAVLEAWAAKTGGKAGAAR